MIVLVVAVPWDSRMVHSVKVFKDTKKGRAEAERYCEYANEHAPGGYTGGIEVTECEVEE